MISRKDKIYDYVKLHTKEMIDTHSLENSGSDALSIALDLKLDRTNVSRELNTLWKEGRLIKLQGRPTLYLDCEALKTEYPNHYIPLTVSAGSSLLDFIQKPQKTQKRELPFHKTALDAIIGSAGSLKNETAQVLAAISYPSGGLPVLLVGSAGVGKRKFAESLFLYSQETGVFDENARFIIINCQDYAHSEERLMLQLLGHTKTSAPGARSAKGLLDAANKGIVYFDGLHKLPSKSIDLVIDLLKNNAYTRVGENRPRPLEAVIMASVRDNLDADFMDTLRSNFPIAVSLPDFYRRSSQEKIEMILDLVTREAYSIHKNIRLDKSVLTAFALPHYPRNESQLRSEIQSACSKAFVEPKNQDACFLTITFDHLSDFVLSAANTCPDDNHAFIRTLALYKNNSIICESNGHCDALDFYKELPLSSDESTSDGAAGSDSPSADARPSLLIVCHGHATASDMQAYTAAQAAQAQAAFADYGQYLDSLEMTATIRPFEAVYMQRIAQLTNKSNQFNLTTLRCTEDDIRSMAEKPDWITLYGKLVDKFADNGVVTVVAGQAQGRTLCLRLWLMSCRVLKRGMEDAMMDTLAAKAAAAGYTALEGYYYPTAKNAMVREFYAGYGFEKTAEDADGNTTWRLDLAAYNPRCPHIKIET